MRLYPVGFCRLDAAAIFMSGVLPRKGESA